MITYAQALTMVRLQNKMNRKVNKDWRDAGYPWLLAIVMEGAEAIEHHGWKWWKAQEPNFAQLKMEVVDIWHFILSQIIVDCEGDLAWAAGSIAQMSISATGQSIQFEGKQYALDRVTLLKKLELLIGIAAGGRISFLVFDAILTDCGLSATDLFQQYVAKNVLNMLRQDLGYKAGTYHKIWEGREDNEHLVEIMATLDASSTPDYSEVLYKQLHQRYVGLFGVTA